MTLRYRCQNAMLPVVEASLAANGYAIDLPMQRGVGGVQAMVMSCGAASVLLAQIPNSETLEIEIWGVGQSHASSLLEKLPIRLHRWPMAQARSGGERYD